MSTLTQIEIAVRNHRRAVRFFWSLLIGATMLSLLGHIAHAVLSHLPRLEAARTALSKYGQRGRDGGTGVTRSLNAGAEGISHVETESRTASKRPDGGKT
jgi:hypothetical protein